jgi:hypothetical protein
MDKTKQPRFRLFKATPSDSERLKVLYAEKSLEGNIQINLDRSPDFFKALQVEGFENGVYAVEDQEQGPLAGVGIRNLRKCYINGKVHVMGYLSGLRVAESHRKSRAMAMIFSQLRKLYVQNECPGYLCSVFNSNKNALRLLTSGKGGLPTTKVIGQYHTYAFRPRRINRKKSSDFNIQNATMNDVPTLVQFLNEEGRNRQFFPCYSQKDFEENSGILQDLKVSDIQLAYRNNELIGCCGLWNQTRFRRWKVEGYSRELKIFRPLVNVFLAICGFPQLPPEHQSFQYRLLSLVCIKNNDKKVFRELLNSVMNQEVSHREILISAGFFDHDPLIPVIPRFRFTFKSTIFIGYWKETSTFISEMDQCIPYLEAGSL